MRSSKRLTIACLVALLLSGGCTYLMGRSLARHADERQLRSLYYAAPSHAVAAGVVLRNADIRMIRWPASSPVEGAFAQAGDVVGRASLYPLATGQPVVAAQLSDRGAGTGLASRIPDGMRAIALQSDDIVGVGGFLSPGSHVDMLVTCNARNASELESRSVLQNVAVLAAGQRTEPDPRGRPATSTVVTLLLTPEQAQVALLANSLGAVHFVLRNSADGGMTVPPPVSPASLGVVTGGMAGVMPARLPKMIVKAPIREKTPVSDAADAAVEIVLGGQGAAAGGAR